MPKVVTNTGLPSMTGEAINRRLRIVSELRNLCLSLGKARRLGPLPTVQASDANFGQNGESQPAPEPGPLPRPSRS